MKTLKELKNKIKLGTKIKKVDMCGTYSKNERLKTTLNQIRIVDKVQSNAFRMNGSWLYWETKDCYEIEENGFSLYFKGYPHTHDNLIGKYEFV